MRTRIVPQIVYQTAKIYCIFSNSKKVLMCWSQLFMERVEYVDPLTGCLNMNMPAITDAYLVKTKQQCLINLKMNLTWYSQRALR